MMPGRPKRIAVAAWLAIIALGIQALIPSLLAAEIQLAGAEGRTSLFTLCAFGHAHPATDHDGDNGSGTSQHDQEIGAACPICIALLASPPFTAPALIVLPLPAGNAVDGLVAAAHEGRVALTTAVYRSRAPPIG